MKGTMWEDVSPYWGVILFAVAALTMYIATRWSRSEFERWLRRSIATYAEFLEPGTGAWMPTRGEVWYAISDSGSLYGGPWPTREDALGATRHSRAFLEEYDLTEGDVEVALWDQKRNDRWTGDSMGAACNIVSSAHLLRFWARDAWEEDAMWTVSYR